MKKNFILSFKPLFDDLRINFVVLDALNTFQNTPFLFAHAKSPKLQGRETRPKQSQQYQAKTLKAAWQTLFISFGFIHMGALPEVHLSSFHQGF